MSNLVKMISKKKISELIQQEIEKVKAEYQKFKTEIFHELDKTIDLYQEVYAKFEDKIKLLSGEFEPLAEKLRNELCEVLDHTQLNDFCKKLRKDVI